MSLSMPAKAQLVSGPRGYDDFKIGVAGYTYRSYDIDQTLAFLKSMDVKYFSVKECQCLVDVVRAIGVTRNANLEVVVATRSANELCLCRH